MIEQRSPGMDEAEVQRIKTIVLEAAEREAEGIARLLASKANGELFGQTEFQLRELALKIAAGAIERVANERAKKGLTKAVALLAPAAACGGS